MFNILIYAYAVRILYYIQTHIIIKSCIRVCYYYDVYNIVVHFYMQLKLAGLLQS